MTLGAKTSVKPVTSKFYSSTSHKTQLMSQRYCPVSNDTAAFHWFGCFWLPSSSLGYWLVQLAVMWRWKTKLGIGNSLRANYLKETFGV